LEVHIRYLIIALSVILFVILYVWQNVEITKIKIMYKNVLKEERELTNRNDRLRFEIEKLRKPEIIEKKAADLGMRDLDHDDFITIISDNIQ